MKKVVLGIFAHPDDCEFMCAGTLTLLYQKGWSVYIATMTPGDKGSNDLPRRDISEIRKKEAGKSARLIQGIYRCLGFEDLFIFYDRDTICKTTKLIRDVRPDIVFTASPNDYMIDHEITSHIVETACFSSGISNLELNKEPYEPVPYLFYCDPLEGKDKFGNLVIPKINVDITELMPNKEKMLSCHVSQAKWLKEHHGVDQYSVLMKDLALMRGKEINVRYAEGFRQHLGHSFPSGNILREILGDLVVVNQDELITVNHSNSHK